MHTEKIADSNCPACRYELTTATNMTGMCGPKPGDFTVCANCGKPLRFTAAMGLEVVTMAEVPPELWRPFAVIQLGIGMRKAARN